MSSPYRTTSLLVLKKSNGRISHDSREKEDVLSLKPNENVYWIFFFSSFLRLVFSFVLSFLLLFFSFSLFSFLIFLSFSLLLWSFFSPFLEKSSFGQWEEIASSFPQTKVWLSFFHISFSYFLNDIITTWLHMGHGISFPTHGSLCAILLSGPHGFAKCHSFMVPCGISSPCHVSSDTICLEKREIPTTSEFNEIRRGS